MMIPKEIFEKDLNDYLLERLSRIYDNPIFKIFFDNCNLDKWIVLNNLWKLQYYGVKYKIYNPNDLKD